MSRRGSLFLAATLVAWAAQTGVAVADNCGGPSDCFSSQRAAILALIAIATIAAFVVGGPGAAFVTFFLASDAATVATGRDPLTWEKTPRWVGALGIIDPTPGNVGGRLTREVGERAIREAAEEAAERAAREAAERAAREAAEEGGERAAREAAEEAAERAAREAAEERPPLRLPAADRGSWSGTAGNSDWTPSDPAHWGLKPGESVPFRDGTPDFTQYAHARPSGQPGSFEVPGLTGDHAGDLSKAVKQLADEAGWTQRQTKQWLSDEGLRVHHYKGNEMQLVPSDLHKIAHQGGASDLRGPP